MRHSNGRSKGTEPSSTTLDTTEMVKSYKMLVLIAMLNEDRFPGSIGINDLADHVEQLATRTTRASADLGSALNDRKTLIGLLEQNPGRGVGRRQEVQVASHNFTYRDEVFQTTFADEPGFYVPRSRRWCASWPNGDSPSISIAPAHSREGFPR